MLIRTTYYENLNDLPLINWRMYNETGDKAHLLKSGMLPDLKENMDLAWYKLNDEYLEKFGGSQERNSNLRKRKKLCSLLFDYCETGSMTSKMETEILQVELLRNAKANEDLDTSFLDVVAYAEKFFGFQINEHETSTIKFFTYLKSMKRSD